VLLHQNQTPIYLNAISAERIENQQGLPVPVNFEELSIAANLLDENAPCDLPSLTKRFLADEQSQAIVSNPGAPHVAQAINETVSIRQIWEQGQIAQQLAEHDLEFLYREIELPALAPLAAMMDRGVLFDVAQLPALGEKDAKILKMIMPYMKPVTGRIYPKLDSLGSRTGRIQCSNPNMQGLPIDLRNAVVATEGHVLLAADLSQFELRVLAHFSREPAFLDAYQSGNGDLHCRTVHHLYEKPLAEVTAEERQLGKTINFSIINGQSPRGLARELEIQDWDALIFINYFLSLYPKVASWIDNSIQVARQQGYVTSLYGRRRHLPELNSENPYKAARAERRVMSGIIQATGADIFKWLLGQLYQKLPSEFKMILPIHDAILFEIPEDRTEEATQLIRQIMQEFPPKFTIPLVVNIGVGKSWAASQAEKR
jgi:DNA polymerase I-like protein with 3'-5' exonuclease and polymerase domains